MARSLHRRLLPLLLAACFLLRLQVFDCSAAAAASSPADEPREPAGGAHGAAPHHQVPVDAEARAVRASMELADYGRTGDSATTSAAIPGLAEGVVALAPRPPRETSGGRALVRAGLRPAVLLRSKLARRLLVAAAGVDAAAGTDGAGPSCHSNNVHINCPPASKP
ncbi:hypothetical protein PAHAL_9G113700 [Panicum hallii]|uniref:Uncharacterized protein n=1 Tax=Panicum hallii TaxID=206008 RepID=A0A2S3IJA5_9POAL|nr:hypothetical protein PAHAL_9G113700 [Panicum hallii]